MTTSQNSKLPTLLSFQRAMIVSDGIMKSRIRGKDGQYEEALIPVIRHGIRGILPKKKRTSEGFETVANIQRTETAKTDPNSDGLIVEFSLKMVNPRHLISSCSDDGYRKKLDQFFDEWFKCDVEEFEEVCRRLARNILNGRWLWRNRILGDYQVEAELREKKYSGKGSKMRDFNDYTDDEKNLAKEVIRKGLLAELGESPTLKVRATVNFGMVGSVEVFPSQNMVTNTPKGFARSLYKVDVPSGRELSRIFAPKDPNEAGEWMADLVFMGYAALRDQKISNAIRTIDTWYDQYEKLKIPIPIEPNGASLELNEEFRTGNSSAQELLKKISDIKHGEGFNTKAAFLIGIFIRGGFFSEGQES